LDALDRLARGPVDPAPFVATVREALERLREERDEWERKAPVWTAQAVEPWQRRAEVAEVENQRLTEGLREIAAIKPAQFPNTAHDNYERAIKAVRIARGLLSANPPQGDAADFCEHGYTTEDSAHPSAGLERCPTCSPSDGGGAK
jgi:hypothetical protein